MKSINVTDEQYDFLMKLAQELKTQNNAWTQNPLYIVYDWEKVPTSSDYADDSQWREIDGECFYDSEEECIEALKENYDDETYEPEEGEDYEQVYYLKKRVYVATFFTRKAAEQFIKVNEYHWHEPHIYVESMWRNYEFQGIVRAIAELDPAECPNWMDNPFKE